MVSRLNIAIIGAGRIGQAHAQRIINSKAFNQVTLCDPSPPTKAFAKEISADYLPNIDMLDQDTIDAYLIASPNHLHFEHAHFAIETGKPLLIEKPVTGTLKSAMDLLQIADSKGATHRILVGHHRRHSPVLQNSKEIIRSGRLGRLVTASVSAQFRKPSAYFEEGPWRTQSGGGPILINLIHEIDALRYLIGEIQEVTALASNTARQFSVEDTAGIVFRHHNGCLSTVMLSDAAATTASWEQTVGEDSTFYQDRSSFCYQIAGDQGSFRAPTFELIEFDNEPSWTSEPRTSSISYVHHDPLIEQIRHFREVILGRATPLVTLLDGVRNIAIVQAILDSIKHRSTIMIDDSI